MLGEPLGRPRLPPCVVYEDSVKVEPNNNFHCYARPIHGYKTRPEPQPEPEPTISPDTQKLFNRQRLLGFIGIFHAPFCGRAVERP